MTPYQNLKIDGQVPLPTPRERFDLVIFDCDGTLVDSERLNILAIAQLFQEFGFAQYDEKRVIDDFSGWQISSMLEKISNDTGFVFPKDTIQRFLDRVHALAPKYMKPIDSAIDMVCTAQSFAKTCVVSNGEHQNLIFSLEFSELLPLFPKETIFSGDMPAHPKPAPDPFLLAAQKSKVTPEKTLVIEDSLTGVAGALAAKMCVWGFCGTHHNPLEQEKLLLDLGAERVFHTLLDLEIALSA